MGIRVLTSFGNFVVGPNGNPNVVTVKVSSATHTTLRKLLGPDGEIRKPDGGRDYVAVVPRDVLGRLIIRLV